MRDEDVGQLEMTVTEARRRVDERFMLGEISGADADRRHQRLGEIGSGQPIMGMQRSYGSKRKLAAIAAEA